MVNLMHNCKKIAEQHGGDLIPSSRPGEGTTFKLVIPRFQPKAEHVE